MNKTLRFERNEMCRTTEISSIDGSPVAYLERPGQLQRPVDYVVIPDVVFRAWAELRGYGKVDSSS